MTYTGVGFDRRVMGDTMPITDQQDLTGVPGVQSVSVPGQVGQFRDLTLHFFRITLFLHFENRQNHFVDLRMINLIFSVYS